MKIVDANVIIRYLLNDNPEQSEKAKIAIQEGSFATSEIIAEVIYVLLKVYSFSRDDISWDINCLLLDINTDYPKVIRYALGIFNQTNLDFVDCMIIAYNKVLGLEFLSFDKKLNNTATKNLMIFDCNN